MTRNPGFTMIRTTKILIRTTLRGTKISRSVLSNYRDFSRVPCPCRHFHHQSHPMRWHITCCLVLPAMAVALSSPVPPPPPISMPVWSLACPQSSTKTSMNIMTFCTPVSISPKLWAVALYHETLTKASFLEHGSGILQLLTPSQHPLVGILGKQSGYQIDKQEACKKVGICWERLSDLHVLPECAAYLELKVQSSMIEAGDHVVVICEVMKNGVWRNGGLYWLGSDDAPQSPLDAPNVLYTGWLRDQGIL